MYSNKPHSTYEIVKPYRIHRVLSSNRGQYLVFDTLPTRLVSWSVQLLTSPVTASASPSALGQSIGFKSSDPRLPPVWKACVLIDVPLQLLCPSFRPFRDLLKDEAAPPAQNKCGLEFRAWFEQEFFTNIPRVDPLLCFPHTRLSHPPP